MQRSILTLLLTVAAAFMLAGCGDDYESDAINDDAAIESDAEATPPDAPVPSDESAEDVLDDFEELMEEMVDASEGMTDQEFENSDEFAKYEDRLNAMQQRMMAVSPSFTPEQQQRLTEIMEKVQAARAVEQ